MSRGPKQGPSNGDAHIVPESYRKKSQVFECKSYQKANRSNRQQKPPNGTLNLQPYKTQKTKADKSKF
jgi:hypothetical protein